MFDFLIRKSSIKGTQKFIDKLVPKVNITVPEDLSLNSLSVLKRHCKVVAVINGLEEQYAALTDEQLKAKTIEFKEKYNTAVAAEKKDYDEANALHIKSTNPEEREALSIKMEETRDRFRKVKQDTLKEILPDAFALTREAGKRVLNMRHFDVQLVGGMVLNEGNIAEMTTGEGKTLVATLPSYLNALTGEGAHVVTVNDYLAKRDMEWMGPLFEFLGLSVGVIQHDMTPDQRQQNYGCDITYGTNNEFGFDYLRDNMVIYKEDMVQRVHHFAVVDEVDSILVDEARTPLIISGPAEESTDKYYKAYEVGKQMTGKRMTEQDQVDAKYKEIDLGEGVDYLADEKAKSVSLTDQGEERGAKLFGVDNLHEMDTIEYRHHILQALKAKEFFVHDVDYVVRDKEVIIVDEFTGRMMPGRRWSDGLHQAVEAKEGLKIERENQTLATITFQNYFRMYEKLSGMTGTAETEATEFKQIYDLDVVAIPTNKPIQRKNFPDAIYKTMTEKYNAVVDEIEECHKKGQPVLVGTISIEKSERIADLLKKKGITHKVLNAKFHEMEAHIIAQAGRYNGVTIATNMAGRGTDIVLGGNAEFLARSMAEDEGKKEGNENVEDNTAKFLEQFTKQCKEEHAKVIEAGGLHVIGTERHESRRIDNQLRGRQGRQGDPGSSRFYISLEDDLMRLFATGIMDKMERFWEEGQSLEHPLLSRALETAQKRVEGHNFEIRKHLLEYDDVMNKQREVIYALRRSVLESGNIQDLIKESIEEYTDGIIDHYLFAGEGGEMNWDTEGLALYLKTKFNFEFGFQVDKLVDMPQEKIHDLVLSGLQAMYTTKEEEFGAEEMRHVERMLLMNIIDAKWKDHLYAMDQLKEGVGLRSYAQRNPLIEYKKEGFEMFQMMYTSINHEMVEVLYKIQRTEGPTKKEQGVFNAVPQNLVHKEAAGLSDVASAQQQQMPQPQEQQAPPAAAPIRNDAPKVGRNDPCTCGSGKKYKKCCGQ